MPTIAHVRLNTLFDISDALRIADAILGPPVHHHHAAGRRLMSAVILHTAYRDVHDASFATVRDLLHRDAVQLGVQLTLGVHDTGAGVRWRTYHGRPTATHPYISEIGRELRERPVYESQTLLFWLRDCLMSSTGFPALAVAS